jgi:integrase
VESPEPILHRRAVIVVLAGTGLRNQELCDLDWRRVDLVKGRIDIPDAKTDAGIREVRLTRRVVAELRSYRASLGSPRAGYVFATATGNKRDRKNVCDAIVKRAAACADETRQDRGLMPLPAGVTPHALRCTYIAFALEAGYPLKYVMEQVGHEDESTTMRIYARVLKRQSRNDLDERFDGLIAA